MTDPTNLPAAPSPTSGPATDAHPDVDSPLEGLEELVEAVERREPRWLKRLSHWLGWGVVALYFLFCFAVLGLRYAVLPNIGAYRTTVEDAASRALGLKVSVDTISADWRALNPRLTLGNVTVFDRDGRRALSLPRVRATLSWQSVAVAQLRLESLEIDKPDLDVRRDADGKLYVGGIFIDTARKSDGALEEWVLAQREIVIRGARLRWNDALRKAPELGLEKVDFLLQRSGRRHRFGFAATPPGALAARLDLRGQWDAPLFALRQSDSARWRGQLYLNMDYADLAGWHAYVDYPVELTRGNGALRAWLGFAALATDGGAPARLELVPMFAARQPELTVDLRLANVVTRLKPDLPLLGLTSVTGRLLARQMSGGHEIGLRDFSLLASDGMTLDVASLSERYVAATGSKPEQGELRTSRLDLETLASLTERLPFSAGLRKLLADYQPRGKVRDLNLQWQGPIEAPGDFTVSGNFDNLAIRAQPKAPDAAGVVHPGQPGFENLSGALTATPKSGTLTLAASAGVLSFPGLFAEPDIRYTKLAGTINWTRNGDDLAIAAPTLHFENDDAAGSASLNWKRGPGSGAVFPGPGWLELDGTLTRADARRVPRYLPLRIPDQTRNYLEHALLAGSSDDTSFRVRGDLHGFPYRPATTPTTTAPVATAATAGIGSVARMTSTLRQTLLGKQAGPTAGEFRVVARLHKARFDYAPGSPDAIAQATPAPLAQASAAGKGAPPARQVAAGAPRIGEWPVIDDIEGDLIIDRTQLVVEGRSARIYGVKLSAVRVELPDMADPEHVLSISGAGDGPLNDYLRFVNISPIGVWTHGNFATARATGNAHLDLKLALPLRHMPDAKVNGAILLAGNDLGLGTSAATMAQRVSGRVEFSEAAVGVRGVTGNALGGPFKIDGGARPDGSIALRGEGTANIANVRRLNDNLFLQHLLERLDGQARYTVAVNLRGKNAEALKPGAEAPAEIIVESTLAGLAVDLPAPFRKASAESMPVRVELVPLAGDSEEIRARIGTSFNALFERKRDATGQMAITRAAYGVNEPAILNDNAGYANVNLKSLDLDAWQTVIAQLAGPATAAPANGPANALSANNFLPDVIAARAGELRISGKTFANVIFAASRNNNVWQANVDADQVSGYLTWREGATASQQGRLTARLARLNVPQSAASEVATMLDTSPHEIPELDIIADNFELRDKKLGRLELVANNVGAGARREWRLQKLNVSNADATLDARGVWGPDAAGRRRTALNFNFAVGNVGNLMDRLGMKNTVRNGTAKLDGDVAWHGSPLALDYPSMNGKLKLEADKGQFLKADPGIAKLLGVLSLQALPRRITLDFRDVFSEGFAFDSIRATSVIENGSASTHDFKMRGIAATVLIDGSADLARETQNLRVLVLPDVNAGAGSLAYALLANPAIGLATFVAQALLRDPLSKAFSFEYNISGPWTEPAITKVGQRDAASPREQPASKNEAGPAGNPAANPPAPANPLPNG